MDVEMIAKKKKPAYDGRGRHVARKRALEIIEEISIHQEGDETWTMVYRIVHVALGRCGNPHPKWEQLLNDTWDELRGEKSNDQ